MTADCSLCDGKGTMLGGDEYVTCPACHGSGRKPQPVPQRLDQKAWAKSLVIEQTEAQFQRKVTQLAEERGWDWMHIGRVGRYVANGAKGTLGPGWPDLTLVRGARLIFAELKAQRAPLPSTEQRECMLSLSMTPAETYVWRPSDWPQILEVLT